MKFKNPQLPIQKPTVFNVLQTKETLDNLHLKVMIEPFLRKKAFLGICIKKGKPPALLPLEINSTEKLYSVTRQMLLTLKGKPDLISIIKEDAVIFKQVELDFTGNIYKILMYNDKYVNETMLSDGIFYTETPTLFPLHQTIEIYDTNKNYRYKDLTFQNVSLKEINV